MCRRTALTGVLLAALGTGFILSCIIDAVLLRIIIGAVLIAAGLLIINRHG